MKKILISSFLLFCLYACNNSDREANPASSNDIDAARNFIQAALNGDFDKAKSYMVNDSLNLQDLAAIVRLNERLSAEEKKSYKAAVIRIHEKRSLNDSASMVTYSNSYRNKKDSLKVVNIKGEWLVDFKFIFKHKTDSLQ